MFNFLLGSTIEESEKSKCDFISSLYWKRSLASMVLIDSSYRVGSSNVYYPYTILDGFVSVDHRRAELG